MFLREAAVDESLTNKVRNIVAEHFRIAAGRLTDEARLRDDLGADWLDRLELMIAIEDQVAGFEMNDVVVDQIDTVGDLVRLRYAKPGNKPGRCGCALKTHNSYDRWVVGRSRFRKPRLHQAADTGAPDTYC